FADARSWAACLFPQLWFRNGTAERYCGTAVDSAVVEGTFMLDALGTSVDVSGGSVTRRSMP
ncbi:MAG: hypothetical protein ACJAQ3_003139, partial [Planctomycetota bacterium]